MKHQVTTCDTCGKQLSHQDAIVRDYIDNRSDGDACEDCFLRSELAAETTKRDILSNAKPGTTLKKMLQNYQG